MSLIGLCFCHGWGFSSDYWKPLISSFEGYPIQNWNLGYFGERSLPLPDPSTDHWIAIGHSIGFRSLMESKAPWKGAIVVQGFFDFLGPEPRLRKIRDRSLTQMREGWEKNPSEILQGFYKACQIPSTAQPLGTPALNRLKADLHSLQSPGNFASPLNIPHLVLGSRDDQIVPPPLLESEWNSEKIRWSAKGGHALGFFESDFVIESIHSLIREVRENIHP
ncbi:MAG: hypothetical protein V4507_02860 [Verrucomicrobiota bacterium]